MKPIRLHIFSQNRTRVSIVKYKQDYYVNPDAPISQLMVANFQDFKDTRKEGGLWLRDLFKFFRSQSVYKRDVERSFTRIVCQTAPQPLTITHPTNSWATLTP